MTNDNRTRTLRAVVSVTLALVAACGGDADFGSLRVGRAIYVLFRVVDLITEDHSEL